VPAKRRTRVTVDLTEQEDAVIDMMLRTGTYGLDRADVVRRLIDEGIQRVAHAAFDRTRTKRLEQFIKELPKGVRRG